MWVDHLDRQMAEAEAIGRAVKDGTRWARVVRATWFQNPATQRALWDHPQSEPQTPPLGVAQDFSKTFQRFLQFNLTSPSVYMGSSWVPRRHPRKEANVHPRNVVVLVGRLAGEPVLRYVPNGTPVVEFGLAVNRSTRKPDGSFEDALDGFFECELFGGQAVVVAENMRKGSEVTICGSLHQNKFKASDGRNISKILVRVKTISTVVPTPKAEATAPTQQQTAEPQPA